MTFDPFQIGGKLPPGTTKASAQSDNPDPLQAMAKTARGSVMNTTNFLNNKNRITRSMNPNRAATMSILTQTGARQ